MNQEKELALSRMIKFLSGLEIKIAQIYWFTAILKSDLPAEK